jgi:hypothetical protein
VRRPRRATRLRPRAGVGTWSTAGSLIIGSMRPVMGRTREHPRAATSVAPPATRSPLSNTTARNSSRSSSCNSGTTRGRMLRCRRGASLPRCSRGGVTLLHTAMAALSGGGHDHVVATDLIPPQPC